MIPLEPYLERAYEFGVLEDFLRVAGRPGRDVVGAAQAARSAVEAMAPTHPHPGSESAAKNLTLGPFAAVIDRTRDAVRKAMGEDG